MALDYAATGGQLDILKWLDGTGIIDSKQRLSRTSICAKVAGTGNLETLKWLRENGYGYSFSSITYAAKGGHLEVLQWLKDNDYPLYGSQWEGSLCVGAAGNGHLEVLQWLKENNCHWNLATTACAAGNGQLETLQWLVENGCLDRQSLSR